MERGEIYHVDLNPIQGREQAGQRYVLVILRELSTFWERHSSARSRKVEISLAMQVSRFH